MGVGEGDFHRTRLIHSIEVAQIGSGLLDVLRQSSSVSDDEKKWLPSRDLIETSCFAHDLGHPPFGHRGEIALQQALGPMRGFEGNGQTLRILTKLEKHSEPGIGIDPTRRLTLAVLKYPVRFGDFPDALRGGKKPPKCYLNEETPVVDWACDLFSKADQTLFRSLDGNDKPPFRTLDCTIMELADDIAYGVHDLEDIVARGLTTKETFHSQLTKALAAADGCLRVGDLEFTPDIIANELFRDSFSRKKMISSLVNAFVTSV